MRMLQRFYTGLQRLAILVAAAVLLWMQARAVLMFVEHDWIAVRFPYPLDYGEGPLLDQIVRLAHFDNIYRVDLTIPPYTVSPNHVKSIGDAQERNFRLWTGFWNKDDANRLR